MAKSEASVDELVGMIHRGELRLPEMQRRYVWKKTRVRDLVDSLYRGYPSGTILLWETDDDDIPLQEFSIEFTPAKNLPDDEAVQSLRATMRTPQVREVLERGH